MHQTLSHRNACLVYIILFFALIYPYWLFGEVIAPYRPFTESKAPQTINSTNIENPKFSDYWRVFTPEIRDHLEVARSGSIALWTNHNELGRPLYQISGFGPAYVATLLISKITSSPFRLLTLLSLSMCFFAGAFLLLLCKELSLQPIAGLVAGGTLAASPLMMYWLTFPLFLAVYCWSAGLFYALTRLARKIDLRGGALLAFSSYSLLMLGYPQAVIYHAYMLAAYFAWLSYRRWRLMGMTSAAQYLFVVGTAGGTGILLALPVYLDLAEVSAQSARVSPALSFFTAALPVIDSPWAAMRLLALGTFPELVDNPISPTYPFTYDGLSVTPLVIFFTFFSLLRCWRQTWGCWIAIVVVAALTFIHPLYAFAVQYMGFNLSRSQPLGAITLPMTLIYGYGVNAFVGQSLYRGTAARSAILGTLACLAAAFYFYWSSGLHIRWHIALATLAVIGLLAAQLNSFRPTFLITALVVVAMYLSFPLMLRQPPANLTATSPLDDKVIAATAAESRFAIVAPGVPNLLPPNMNAVFDLSSIHSYNSLSSRQYQTLIRQLGGETDTYGRSNEMISPDYDSQAFWMSNISLIISPRILHHPNLESVGGEGIHLYRTIDRMGCCLQTALPAQSEGRDIELADKTGTYRPYRSREEGDLLEFEVQAQASSSLLVLSQQFHKNWHAFVKAPSGWTVASTLRVNGVFQGVVLPSGTQSVRLVFHPFARFGWIAHIFWAVILLILAAQTLISRYAFAYDRSSGA